VLITEKVEVKNEVKTKAEAREFIASKLYNTSSASTSNGKNTDKVVLNHKIGIYDKTKQRVLITTVNSISSSVKEKEHCSIFLMGTNLTKTSVSKNITSNSNKDIVKTKKKLEKPSLFYVEG